MRTKSTDKYEALLAATLTLVHNQGFHDAPMSKIARQAGVVPATIYLYFHNKQDLVNKLYLQVKEQFCVAAFDNYDHQAPIKKGFEHIWHNIAHFKLNNVKEAAFLTQCDNTPMIDENIRQEGLKHLQPLLDLWERGKEEGIVKPVSPYLLYAYTVYPLSFLRAIQEKALYGITDDILKQAFQSAWDAIRV